MHTNHTVMYSTPKIKTRVPINVVETATIALQQRKNQYFSYWKMYSTTGNTIHYMDYGKRSSRSSQPRRKAFSGLLPRSINTADYGLHSCLIPLPLTANYRAI